MPKTATASCRVGEHATWKLFVGMVLIATSTDAQSIRDLLLPQPRHIVGVVVDADGKPVPEVRIDHTNDRGKAHTTDSSGKFELDTKAPVLVFRKPGLQSELFRVQDATEVRITLRAASEKRTFPTCSNSGSYVGIDGWGATFRFAPVQNVKVSQQGQDVDYGGRNYYVETKSGPKGISHGSGPMWSFGIPTDMDVWRSVKYEEITYDHGRVTIIDTKGQYANGNHWRYLGQFGESASYSDVDEQTAMTLDAFLDGACIK